MSPTKNLAPFGRNAGDLPHQHAAILLAAQHRTYRHRDVGGRERRGRHFDRATAGTGGSCAGRSASHVPRRRQLVCRGDAAEAGADANVDDPRRIGKPVRIVRQAGQRRCPLRYSKRSRAAPAPRTTKLKRRKKRSIGSPRWTISTGMSGIRAARTSAAGRVANPARNTQTNPARQAGSVAQRPAPQQPGEPEADRKRERRQDVS